MDDEQPQNVKPLLLAIALIQGLSLLVLETLVENNVWPHESPSWLYSLYAMVVIGPLMLLLSLDRGVRWQKVAAWILPFTLLCGLVSFYTGSQVHVYYSVWDDDLLAPLILTLTIAVFKGLMYCQQRFYNTPFQYSFLFLISWRNALTLGLALFFTLAVWGILMLWGGLFRAIGIRFFQDIFLESWFYYPVLALANGLGIIIFNDLAKVIETITRLLQALMKFLLVFLVLVSLLFLGGLLFTGLTPLWDTGFGSNLILWMQGLLLFFLNAVYQDKPEMRPYPLILHRFIYIGIAALPIYSAIVLYGLGLRLDQYGWTPLRCWAFVVWFFFALFSLGYFYGIVAKRDNWIEQLSWVNVRAGLVLLAVMITVNSPLLDFRKITVHSQLARLENGTTTVDNFGVDFFRNQLGQPGYDALEELRLAYADSNPRFAEKIEQRLDVYRPLQTTEFNVNNLLDNLINVDEQPLPGNFVDALDRYVSDHHWRYTRTSKVYVLKVDLDENSVADYLLIGDANPTVHITLFYWEKSKWQTKEMGSKQVFLDDKLTLLDSLKPGGWQLSNNRWKQFELGGKKFSTYEH
ncbi:DUF4153 domain-containing protein [Aurantivibrio plasticivorans]